MSRPWRKGCLCGCLYEDECRYRETTPEVVHVVHHHYHHAVPQPEPELAWPTIEGEVIHD